MKRILTGIVMIVSSINIVNAWSWFEKSSEGEKVITYENKCEAKNPTAESFMWCKQAAEEGNLSAQYSIGYIYMALGELRRI